MELRKLIKGVYLETIALEEQQPDCQLQSVNYGERYSKFLPKVRRTLVVVHYCQRQLDSMLYKKEKIEKLSQIIQNLTTARNIYQGSFAQSSLRFTEEVLLTLKALKHDIENNLSCLTEMQKAESNLNDFEVKLNSFLQPTHLWQLISDENKRRCTKCLKEEYLEEKKPQPTIYDEEPKEYPSYW